MTARGAVAQCPQRAAELMQCGFIIRPGNMRTLILQDNFRLLPRAILHLLEASAVRGVAVFSQPSLVVVKKEAVSYSLFLWPLHFTGQGRFPLAFVYFSSQCYI